MHWFMTMIAKPKRRVFDMLQNRGLQMNQDITFISDGGETVCNLQLYLSPQAEHLPDWFHITMRLTVMKQMARGLPKSEKPKEIEENMVKKTADALDKERSTFTASGPDKNIER